MHTLPTTENEVAEMTDRRANEKYDMPRPAMQDANKIKQLPSVKSARDTLVVSFVASAIAASGATDSTFW